MPHPKICNRCVRSAMIVLLVMGVTINQPISAERRVTSADRIRIGASLDRYLRHYREDNHLKQDGWSERG